MPRHAASVHVWPFTLLYQYVTSLHGSAVRVSLTGACALPRWLPAQPRASRRVLAKPLPYRAPYRPIPADPDKEFSGAQSAAFSAGQVQHVWVLASTMILLLH